MAFSWMRPAPKPVPLKSITLTPDPDAPIYKGVNQSIATTQIRENLHWVGRSEFGRKTLHVSLTNGFRGIWGRDFTIGTSPRCDLVLPELPYVDDVHCVLRLDRPRRLILRDVSKYGTLVTYNDQGRQPLPWKGGQWVVGGDPHLEDFTIDLEITEYLRFQLEANYGVLTQIEKIEMVRIHRITDMARFLHGEILTRLQPPDRNMWIFLRLEYIGFGKSSKVMKGWDVSAGAVFAIKEPHVDPRRDPDFDREKWTREINALSIIANTRPSNTRVPDDWRRFIISLIWASSPSHPILIYEYSSFGTVKDQHAKRPMSRLEVWNIFSQCVNAVAFLDDVVQLQHRDIRPEHVLVMNRSMSTWSQLDIQIKLIGFGQAACAHFPDVRAWDVYRLPAEWPRHRQFKDAAGDLWSSGMVALELIHPSLLPEEESDCAHVKDQVMRAARHGDVDTHRVLELILKWVPWL